MFKQSWLCFVALLGVAALQACASAAPPNGGEGDTGGGQMSTSGGSPTAAAGAPSASGGNANPGSGGSMNPGSAGGASAGSSAGSSSVGTGGSGGGATGGGATGGGATAVPMTQFGQVTALLGKRCAGSKCHSNGATQLAFANSTGSALHTVLTTPIASSVPHCVGVTLVTPNNASSPLLQIVASGGKIACTKPKTESIGPMPDKCTTTSTSQTGVCLNATEIKLISDWIAAGAPLN